MNNLIKQVIQELCTDLQTELDDRYSLRDKYPHQLDKYNSEMNIVRRAKELIKNSGKTDERFFVFYYTSTDPVGSGYVCYYVRDGKFPSAADVGQLALHEISKSLGYRANASINITGFNEFNSKEDYANFQGI